MIPEEFGPNYVTRAHVTDTMRRSDEENEMLKKEAHEAKKQCLEASHWLAGLEAFIGQVSSHYNQQMQGQPGCSPFIFTPPVTNSAPVPIPSSSSSAPLVPVPSSSAAPTRRKPNDDALYSEDQDPNGNNESSSASDDE
nr:hypothetical protein [Tanacetum cinerariifolium]